jgi:hypothetical protein
MENGQTTAHRVMTAYAADLFEGRTPEERTLIDVCRAPFSFGLLLLIPVAIMLTAFVFVLQSRPIFLEALRGLRWRL